VSINFNKWPWKLTWLERLGFAFSPAYRLAVGLARSREETAAAWEASGRSVGKSHPGYAPGSSEDLAYLASEEERGDRGVASRVADRAVIDPTLRDDISAAILQANVSAGQYPYEEGERFTAALRSALENRDAEA
jgi:hypothetical protein